MASVANGAAAAESSMECAAVLKSVAHGNVASKQRHSTEGESPPVPGNASVPYVRPQSDQKKNKLTA
jgi:hypothetical protein